MCSELDCFQGVADLVTGFANGHQILPRRSDNKALKSFSFTTAKVLSILEGRRAAEVSEVVRATGLSRETVLKQLSTLRRFALVDVTQKGKILVTHKIRSPFREIAAYEVKVRDWKSGLHQARNYRSFAHRVTLALPLARAQKVRKYLSVFRQFKVGLLGIGNRGQMVWLLKPRKLKPISPARNFLASIYLLTNGAPRQSRFSRRA